MDGMVQFLIAYVKQDDISSNCFVILTMSLVIIVKLSSCLGEMCTHVATLLHAMISAHEVKTNTSFTEDKISWIDNTSKLVIITFDSIIMSSLNKHCI